MNNNNEGKNKRFNAYDYLVIVGVIIMILVVVSVGSYAYVTWRGEDTSGGLTTTICMQVKSESEVAQSCPTFCDPMDCSLQGSSVHGIFQAKVLEWGAIAFSWRGLGGSYCL